MLITNEGLFQIFSEGKQNNVDVLELLKRRNENKMNKYKMAVSCGKGFGIVKTVKKHGLILLLNYLSTLRLTIKSRSAFLLVAGLMVLSVKMSF